MKNYKYNKDQKVEDSTKGRADVNPRTYKGDVYAQAWVDSRKLATLSIWLDDNGWRTRFLSEVIKFTLDIVLENLIESKTVEMIEFTEDARVILEAKYNAKLNPGERGKNNRTHNLTLDGRRKSGQVGGYNPESRVSYNPVPPKDDKQPTLNNSTEMSEENSDMWNRAIKKAEEETKKKALEDFKSGCDIDENGNYMPKGEPHGVIYQEDKDAFDREEERRKKLEANEKEIERMKKRIERRKDKVDILEEREEEGDG